MWSVMDWHVVWNDEDGSEPTGGRGADGGLGLIDGRFMFM